MVSSAADAPINSRVNAAVRGAKGSCQSIGVHVVDLSTGETVYAYNADRQKIIASNTKLFTTAAALDLLGPGYQFETEVLVRGPVRRGTLKGDLAVVGGGDPNISGRHYQGDPLAVFRGWAEKLAERGIRRIEGDLVLVHGLFEGPMVHPDWPKDQLEKWYEAPVSALSFEDNCALVKISPGTKPGAQADVQLVPRLPVFDVETTALTTSSSRRHKVGVTRGGDEDQLTVWGSFYSKAAPVETWVAVKDPVQYFGMALQQALSESGIEHTGDLWPVEELPGSDWESVLVHRSDLLSTIEVLNKRSQNLYAESLVKLIGARGCARGSWEGGRQVVGEFLDRIGIDAGEYRMADGSGMSRNNRFTPRHLTTLLGAMLEHPSGGEFLRSLPFSGEADLTWEKRLEQAPYRGNVFAKTGRLRGVSTLSGYAKAQSGKVYAFSVLCNSVTNEWMAKDSQDEIVKAIISNG
jgi:D-alanyl-D-alanine carboxypeptidase/D-alanyl-D-alanine-endopeptidase (penicillin-binding protein 4)